MTKDIIKLSAIYLGLTDIIEYLKKPTETLSDDVKEKTDDLLLFTNYIIKEITKSYFPLSHTEDVVSNNLCEIPFKNLSKNAIAIKNLKNQSMQEVTFNLYPEFIKVGFPNTKYTITYNYTPNKLTSIEDKIDLPLGLDYEVVAYGVASEYALSRLLYSEADMWEDKFKSALENIKSKHGERKFYARRLY